MNYVASLSGGKDSAFMVDELIERNMPLTHVVTFDTDMEFQAVYNVLDVIKKKVEDYGAEFIVLRNNSNWMEDMLTRPINIGKANEHYGYEWCGGTCRWRTTDKISIINKYLDSLGDFQQYIGIAYDEPARIKEERNKIYPLVDWKMTEKQCLDGCWERSYNWNEPSPITENGYVDLYTILDRVSCWCCGNKNLKELRNIYHYLPQYWARLKGLQSRIDRPFRQSSNTTIFQLEQRFKNEDAQMSIFDFI